MESDLNFVLHIPYILYWLVCTPCSVYVDMVGFKTLKVLLGFPQLLLLIIKYTTFQENIYN